MRSDGSPLYTPGEISVELITGDTVLERRNLLYAKRTDNYRISCSRRLTSRPEADVIAAPSEMIHEISTQTSSRWIPLIIYGPAERLRAAFAAGCSDFLKDPWTPEELHFRALKLARALTFAICGIDLTVDTSHLSSAANRCELSRQERAILLLLAHNRGTAVPREALSYAARGKVSGTSRAVDMHVSNLRKKITCLVGRNARRSIVSVKGIGYVLTG